MNIMSKCPYVDVHITDIMYLLTEWEGRMGKYLARGQEGRNERSEVRAS